MSIEAVLFDIGGPIDTEQRCEHLIEAHLRQALAAEGVIVSDEDYAAVERSAIASFAPNVYRTIAWMLTGRSRERAERAFRAMAAREAERLATRGGIEVRAGITELLARLKARGLKLGVVANQSRDALAAFGRSGLADYFDALALTASSGFRKPDPRAFLVACDELRVAPEAVVMVGDRIDNDIAPARALGMRAIRLRVGRHAQQRPRAWDEVPDADVDSVPALAAALNALLDA